jgi:PAS domain S-box-containing protein
MPVVIPISEQQFASAFEFAAIGMAVLGPDSSVRGANRALCEMLGYTRQQLLELPPYALNHPEEWQEELGQRAQLLAGASSTYESERRLRRQDGSLMWGHVSCALVRDEGGAPLHFIAQVQDISERKLAEAALRESEERFRLSNRRLREQAELLDQARDAIVVHDLDRTIRYWNMGAQRMFGFSREQAEGRTFDTLMGPGATLAPDAAAQLLETGEWTGQLECVDAQGRMLTVERRCTVMRDNDGRPTGVLAISTDVTERRRAEKEIVLLNNLLEQRIRKRTAELEESNEDLRDFAYSLAHDLRAPLASIDGFSAQLERGLAEQLDDKSRHYLRRVRAGVKLMADLTDALLALADLSNTQLLHQGVDLSAVARSVVERLRELQPERNVTVIIEETVRAQGDVRLLTDVMENLLGNAWKFTSKMPQAEIVFGGQAWPNGSYLYHVKDNGAGFDPTYAYKLFGPFQRLHTSSEFEGTGIGLAMVRKIVSRHGGRVWAESMPGEGASFYFTLNENSPARIPRESAIEAPALSQAIV